MKAKHWIGILISAGLALWLVFGMTIVAVNHPFTPGSLLFPVQQLAEQIYLGLTLDKGNKAEIALNLAERRLVELAKADQARQIERGAQTFRAAMLGAERRILAAPVERQESLQLRAVEIMAQAQVVAQALIDYTDTPAVAALFELCKIDLSAAAQVHKQPAALAVAAVDPVAVSFLGIQVEHESFKLEGGHKLECFQCHTSGEYAGLATACESCHEFSTEISS